MISLINSNLEKQRQIKIIATNGDEDFAIVDDDEKQQEQQDKKERKRIISRNHYHKYYQIHRLDILAKKKIYNEQPDIKQQNAEYHKRYYEQHKEDLNRRQRERYLKRKKNGIQMSQVQ